MWQAGNPNFWLTHEEDNKELYPFVNGNGTTWWKSKDCRDVNNLGYTYDVLNKVNNHATLEATVYDMYYDFWMIEGVNIERHLTDYVLTAVYQSYEVPIPILNYTFFSLQRLIYNVLRNEIGAFTIQVLVEDYEIGRIANFVASPDVGCKNCERHRQERLVVTSSTFISPSLRVLQDKNIISLDVDMEKYLIENLHWTVLDYAVSKHFVYFIWVTPIHQI